MENLLYTLWLHLLPGIGPYLIRKLITTFGSAATIYTSPFDALLKVPGIGTKLAQTITSSKNTSQANSLLEYCLNENIQLIFYQDPLYPQRLLNFPKSPTLLYVKGNLTPFNTHSSAAIVGARRCSTYGKEATLQLSAYLSSQSISILSGMAKGTDSYAHTSAIKNNGYTLAIVGTGLDRCYPSEHLPLMQRIVETGAVISSFPPFTTVHKQNFIRRNELIAMLADQVYVMQATKDSGALYTAQCATTFQKQKTSVTQPKCTHNYSDPHAKELCSLITHQGLTLDTLSQKLHLDLSSLHELIFQLELEGTIYQAGGLIHLS